MSNFLQRVAATVIQPNAKLQPMIGSIFGPSTHYSPAEPFLGEISSQTAAPVRHEPTAAPRLEASSQPFSSHAFATEGNLFTANRRDDFSSASFNRSASANLPLLAALDGAHDLRGTAQQHPSVEDSAFEFSKAADANHSASPNPYQPLIAASQPPPSRLQPRESFPTAASARIATSEAAGRAQSAQREADEIHIHIGRIEVAAAAQPAPRPTAAAARRSLNLDEYLRRGNGRRG